MSTTPPRITRRTFIATSTAGAAGALGMLAACGDDARTARADATATDDASSADAPDTTRTDDATAATEGTTSADTGPGADSAPEVPDATTDDTAADAPDAPGSRFDPDAYAEASVSLFPIGVSATDPTFGGAILATRYLGTAAIELVVWRPDPGRAGGLEAHRTTVVPADGGFIQEDVQDLAPGAEHHFAFIADARRSPIGRFRTPPQADARPVVVLGASSCAKWDFRPFDVLTRAAEDDLDLFLLLGDTTYADEATTLEEYRANWARNLGTAEYRALRTATTCAATWDDHEVDNNWDPEGADSARVTAARQAFFEHMAVRRDPANPDRIWRSFRFGATVEVFLLDCRSERRPSTRTTPQAEYISEAQLAWLDAGLHASPATFKLVLSSVPITRWPPLYLAANERWEGYAAQRARVLGLAADVKGLLWVAGDFHFGAVTTVDPPGEAHADQHEILVGPVAHLNPAMAIVQLTGSPEQFPFLTGERNYGRFTLDPTSSPPRITVDHIGMSGQTLGSYVLEVT